MCEWHRDINGQFHVVNIDDYHLLTEVDWEYRRYEIAKEIQPHIIMQELDYIDRGRTIKHNVAEYSAQKAVEYADALIKELKKYEYGK